MSWSISTLGMSCIHSLAQAKKFWDEQPVWKGQHHSFKPLDSVRMKHKRIVKLSDDLGYELTLYNTPMVTYYTDGSVALHCHDRVSSNIFAWLMRPKGCKPISRGGKMYWQVDTHDGERFYREGSQPLMLDPVSSREHTWQLTNDPLAEKERRYDPKQGALARKAIKPYCQWHKTVERLTGRMPYPSGWMETRKNAVRVLAASPNNVENFPEIAEVLGYPADAREAAYLEFGAHFQVEAPHDRLPRISR